jgi:hypothetical protein
VDKVAAWSVDRLGRSLIDLLGFMTSRRFPAPWRADKMPGGYVVRGRSHPGDAIIR